jgi:hypothetical protein
MEITIVVINIIDRPIIKKNSAIFSYLTANFSFLLLIARNERKLLVIKEKVATAVTSIIIGACFIFSARKDVRTIKQSPSRLDDVFNM